MGSSPDADGLHRVVDGVGDGRAGASGVHDLVDDADLDRPLDSARDPLVLGGELGLDLRTDVGSDVGELAPVEDPDRRDGAHDGDLRARDAAYHQGTVWPWLIGPFVDAWLRVHPREVGAARRMLEGFAAHLAEAGIGSISEIFDAEEPFTPRGCVAQAWSVAEVLRAWVRTGGEP